MAAKEHQYDPGEVEEKWYKYWMDEHLFESHPDKRTPYTIVIPPPNVTGVLHMGHMLNNTIQDILIRRARLKGYNACWVPGTDHASIATEAKVVAKLASEGIQKHDLTREQFLEHAWDWTREHGGIILEQLKRLGASCDWSRTAFTLDEVRNRSVVKVFCQLYEEGLIYRGVRLVHWDPKAETALSDEEVIYKDEVGKLYWLRYRFESPEDGDYLIVATTRPETIMGDTALCVHPEDERYKRFVGKKVIVPLVGRSIPIIADSYVERDFGSGCLKVTPAHDVNDYNLGIKHHLPSIDIFNNNGTLNENGGSYQGMDRFDVRKQIAEDLEKAGLMERIEVYTNRVGYSERTNVPIEPKLSMQWFLKMEGLARPALEAVEQDEVQLIPAKFKNVYRHWMENIKDWCVSRQLWWGHRIPAYYLPNGDCIVAESPEAALDKANAQVNGGNKLTLNDLKPEEDCLDTWFSSWLWPMSVFGDFLSNEENKDLSYYYPTNALVTGPDILFFWVARMIMAGYKFKGERPFRHVYLTGIVRDAQGRKMSKSLGNSPDPIALMNQYGADAVRCGLMMATSAGNDLLYDEALIEQGRNFCNKIWNAYRLVEQLPVDEKLPQTEEAQQAVEWFNGFLGNAINEVEDLMSKYRISEAMTLLYRLFRDDFSSFYLEAIKPPFGQPIDRITHDQTVVFFETLLQLLHPFMPFITEALWQELKPRQRGESIMLTRLPEAGSANEELLHAVSVVRNVITEVRNARNKNNIPKGNRLSLVTPANHPTEADALLRKLAVVDTVRGEESDGIKAGFIVETYSYSLLIDSAVDKEALRKKLLADLAHQEGFLKGVEKKLANERFVANAPEEVVAVERKKQADAKSRIAALQAQLAEIEG